MKKFILVALFSVIYSSSVFALEVSRGVLVRGEDRELVIKKKPLKNLLQEEAFDGKFFKIVKGTSNEAIPMDDSLISRKAANAYYHLEKARTYFQEMRISQKDKAVIRIDIQNAYHRHFHFQNEEVQPVFNNATTVYRGEGNPDFGIPAWKDEIWFRPPKKIELPEHIKEGYIRELENAIPTGISLSIEALIHTGASILAADDMSASFERNVEETATRYVRDKAIRYVIPRISAAFLSDYYYLDTVFVPEIIYHEYAHLIMADELPPVSNNPLIEGVADYYAAKVSGGEILTDELGEHGVNVRSRDAHNREFYKIDLDTEKGLGADFLLSLFYQLDNEVSELSGREDYFAKRLFEMRGELDPDSKIRNELPDLFWEYFPRLNRNIMAILHQRGI